MSIYVILLLLAGFGFFMNVNENRKRKKRYVIFIFGCLLLVAMLRNETTGTDLEIYYSKYFPMFRDASWKNIQNVTRSGHWEWGFCAFCKIIGYISTNTQCFIIFSSILSIVPYGIFIYRNSEDVVFSTIFYITFHVYMNSFNIVRQAMAVGIILSGLEILKRKQYIRYLIYVLIAALIHTSAIVAVLYILADRLKFKKTSIYSLTVVTLVIIVGYNVIFSTALGFLGLSDNYRIYQFGTRHAAGYVTYHTLGMFALAVMIFALTVLYFYARPGNTDCCYTEKAYTGWSFSKFKIRRIRYKKRNSVWSEDMFVFACYLAMAFRMIAFIMNVASRMSYFFIPFLMIAFPHVMGKLSGSERKIITLLIYAGLLLFFVYIGYFRAERLWGTVPYHFFWQ